MIVCKIKKALYHCKSVLILLEFAFLVKNMLNMSYCNTFMFYCDCFIKKDFL